MITPEFQIGFRAHQIAPGVYLAQGAVITGDVTLGADASVWFNAVLRGDSDAIRIGRRTNIQDGAICHADPGFPVTIGEGVTVGHGAIVHGATVGDNCVIGMGAILLNGAVIGANSLVGAGALVTEHKNFPPGALLLGSPARLARMLSDDEIAGLGRSAATYVARAQAYQQALEAPRRDGTNDLQQGASSA